MREVETDRLPVNIVCFSGVDWDSYRQRPQHLMLAFADRGHRVVYVDNLGTRPPHPADLKRITRRLRNWLRAKSYARSSETERNIVVESPIVPPIPQLDLARRVTRVLVGRRLRRKLVTERPLVVWTYLPLRVIRDVAGDLAADLLVYDWADDAAAHVLTHSARHKRRISQWEDETAREADLVFVASKELLRRRGQQNPKTFLMPHGVSSSGPQHPAPASVTGATRPRIGFVGGLTPWTDIDLLDDLAESRPLWSFVLVGPIRTKVDGLRKRENVILLGERPHDEIPALLSAFDAAIIPYRVEPAIQAASPIKLREYLAQGLPVVSVDLPEVREFVPPVRVASDRDGFLRALDDAVTEGKRVPPDFNRSWERCADEMEQLILRELTGARGWEQDRA
jgi:glycosyltransferase involved in cell wall biosynthesis